MKTGNKLFRKLVTHLVWCIVAAAPAVSLDVSAASYTRLTIAKSGAGNGTIRSNPSGINCGSVCSQRYIVGSTITLTATADNGSAFAGWSGTCTGTAATIPIVVNVRSICTATFNVTAVTTNFKLSIGKSGTGSGSVASMPSGIDCGVSCAASYVANTIVTLTATAGADSSFGGWTGNCAGTSAATTVVLTADSTCNATFTLNPPPVATTSTLNIVQSGGGSGTVTSNPAGISCGSACSAAFVTNTTVALAASANAGSVFAGWSGSCTGSSANSQIVLTASATCSASFVPQIVNAYYVATNGSDVTGNGSIANPWMTIAYGISRIAGGDTLIVRNGVYREKANFITGVKGGTAGRPTTIAAESPMEVRIQSTTSLDYYDNQLNLAGNYITVDGFVFDMAGSLYPPYIAEVNGNYNKVTRSIFKRSGNIDTYGGLMTLNGSDNLVEDVAGAGACRYCFKQGGPSQATQRNIWRRVVGRFDYSNSAQPKATFSTYGNDSIATNGVTDHLYQNVMAIDGQNPGTNGGEEKYGGFLTVKAATRVSLQGSIVLNEGVGYSGMHLRDYSTGTANAATHSVVWDLPGSKSIAIGLKGYSADHMTIGGLIPSNVAINLDMGVPSSSLLLPAAKPANLINNAIGAVIMKRYGVSGTRWGEPGFDQLTGEDLWPWPYEGKIKAVFAEPNDVPAGNNPVTNVTKRGFAADGQGLYGGPITLTSYLWEYLGTPCPSTICR